MLIPTDKKPMTYYDTGQAGLCVIVTYGGTKTYYFYTKFLGAPKRVKIGRVGVTKLVDARMKARELRIVADHGNDPAQERNEALWDMTLKQFFTMFIIRGMLRFIPAQKHRPKMKRCFVIIWHRCTTAR